MHAYIVLLCQNHSLVETLPAIIFADSISLFVAHMAISGYEDTNGIRSYEMSDFNAYTS